MAVVYKAVAGEPVERIVAREREVRGSLRKEALAITVKSDRILRWNRDTGSSRVVLVHGDIDYSIVLDDPWAAAIEYGHDAYLAFREHSERFVYVGASKGIRVLRDGAGLP